MALSISGGITFGGGISIAIEPTPAPSGDAFFNSVSLLLHGDGAYSGGEAGQQNNTFLDGSTNAYAITRNGNTTQGTFSPYSVADGEWSNYFDGTGDYLTVADNAAFTVGSGNWTLEAWVYPTASPNQPIIIGQWTGTNIGSIAMMLSNDSNRYLRGVVYSDGAATDRVSTSALSLETWNHCAFVREGTVLNLYLNGSRVDTYSFGSGTINDSTLDYSIGALSGGGQAFAGYISNARLVVGTAVYTGASYTVPTAPLTAISGTALLTCQSNRWLDNSSNTFSISRNGTPFVRPLSPFVPAAAYDPAVNGGSGYFDGTGDYLRASGANLAIGTGPFTIEAWIYIPNTTPFALNDAIFASDTTPGWQVSWSTNGFTFMPDGSNRYLNTSGVVAESELGGAWHHVAYCRTGTSLKGFIDGQVIGTQSGISTNFTNSVVDIGVNRGGTGYFIGYISDVRITREALYSDAFTPPTAPLTAATGTEYLVNFTNAGIYDNSGKNDLATVGNTQIDTTTKKYGTGSIKFDGSGDYLQILHNADQQFGTAPFTVEMWVYYSTPAIYGLICKGVSGSNGWNLRLGSGGELDLVYNVSSQITSSGTVPTNTWTHVALVREGTGTNQTKLYINGINDGTGTVASDFNQDTDMFIGVQRNLGNSLNGFIDDLRITKGVARYTEDFTPPDAPFPDS